MLIYRIEWGLVGINSSHEEVDGLAGNPQMAQLPHWGMTTFFPVDIDYIYRVLHTLISKALFTFMRK